MRAYDKDLAYIHDAGFGGLAQAAAVAIRAQLRKARIRKGLVVDLGCGSGILAREFPRAGYDVLGIDISPAMIALARKRAPGAKFKVASLLSVDLPRCAAVTAIGEPLSYTFDSANRGDALAQLFRRIYAALEAGGVFVFDLLEPGNKPRRNWDGREGLGRPRRHQRRLAGEAAHTPHHHISKIRSRLSSRR